MEGVVTKLEAETNNAYSSDRYVVGTKVTVQHLATGRDKDEVVRVISVVFMPPNSALPRIGDAVEVGVFPGPETVALPEGESDEG